MRVTAQVAIPPEMTRSAAVNLHGIRTAVRASRIAPQRPREPETLRLNRRHLRKSVFSAERLLCNLAEIVSVMDPLALTRNETQPDVADIRRAALVEFAVCLGHTYEDS